MISALSTPDWMNLNLTIYIFNATNAKEVHILS